MPLRVPRVLRVGTDFSGCDMSLLALQHIDGVPRVKHVFASDTNLACRQYLELIHRPETIYEDITERDNASAPPVDVYMWAPPCQHFSTAGRRRGAREARGKLAKYSLKYIRKHRPRLTILDIGAPAN